MENFVVAHSDLQDVTAAVGDIRQQLSGIDACMVLYFASPVYPAEAVSKEMASAFAGVRTAGCSTAGELSQGMIGQDSIVAMAWHKSTLKDLKIEVLENIRTDPDAVAKAFASFEKSLGKPMKHLNASQYVGVVLIDGLSGCEEKLNDQLGNLTNVPFVGGSAADNFMLQRTNLYLDGKAYTDAAILLLMEPTDGYVILKTQSFTISNKKLIPTKVDEERRMVIEFNGRPAAEVYAEALGVAVNDLEKIAGEYPLGLVFDEQNFFVRSLMKVVEGNAVTFFCSVKEGLELTVLRPGDIVTVTRTDLQNCGKVQAVVDFICTLRTTELIRKNQQKAYSEIFGNVPTIGFATYGESYIGHINYTSTMLLLK